MGYYATASGDAEIKPGMEITLKEAIHKFYEENPKFEQLDWEIDPAGWIAMNDFEKYHEEDTETFLEVIAPYITEGCLRYSGEDDEIWRFVFNPETEKWEEETAIVSFGFEDYDDDELIEELEKRGYTVSKK